MTLVKEEEKNKEEKDENQGLRFIELCSDTTFKYLYKNEETRNWFNHIIKNKFNLDLDGYTLVDNELNTGNKRKDYRLDLRLQKDNMIVILEMNKDYYDFQEVKNYQYLYRIAGSRFDSGERYSSKPTKLVLFNHFQNPKDPANKTGNYLFMDPNTGIVIDDIESFEIYLPNFKNICYDNNEVDVSLSLFSAKSYDSMRKLTKNPEDLKIIKKLEELAMNEKFLYEYDQEAVRIKTENSIRYESYEKGKEEGESNKQIEIAKSMLKENISIQVVSKCTGLSIDEIKFLQEK